MAVITIPRHSGVILSVVRSKILHKIRQKRVCYHQKRWKITICEMVLTFFKIKTSSMLGSTIHRHCEVGRGEQLTRRQQLGDRAPNRFGMNDACKKKSCWGLGLNDGNSEDSLPPQQEEKRNLEQRKEHPRVTRGHLKRLLEADGESSLGYSQRVRVGPKSTRKSH